MNVCLRLGLVAALLSISAGALAQETGNAPRLGIGVVCDTEQHISRYLKIHADGAMPEAALQEVNTAAKNSGACAIVHAAFTIDKDIDSVAVDGGRMRVFQITVLAEETAGGWRRVTPRVQFTAAFESTKDRVAGK